jgi:protein TonB
MEKGRKTTNRSFVISLAIHILLLIFLFVHEKTFDSKREKPEKMEVQWVEFKEQPEPLKEAQIVEQDDKSLNDQVPEDNYKLSKNNQDVLKETKAQKHGEFQNRRNQVAGEKRKPEPKQEKVSEKQKVLDQLKPSLYDTQYAAKKLAPPPEPAMSGAEVSQNDDYLKDVVAGAETLLKTREFVYYSYYNRIKKRLKQHWEPRIQEKIVKILRKGRKIASVNDKITHLVITLDKHGELKRIQVKQASGYNDLDDAAIEAFRAAAPFPNPPKGIVTGAGEVQIPWSFVLET